MTDLERSWYADRPLTFLLPLAAAYGGVARARRWLYRHGWLRSERLPVPVVVVGNLTVGGTGKTPLVAWLVREAVARGWRPGIITRGYGGRSRIWPQPVGPDSDPDLVGDEPVLLARHALCPVVADPQRVRGAKRLCAQGCDLIVADDGLQHYPLARDLEIAVIDGERRFGNGRCLPAGPLREPVDRLNEVDARVTQGQPQSGEWGMKLEPVRFRRLGAAGESAGPETFRGERVHAVAGIGHPDRFFAALRVLGLAPIEHAFRDHHRFAAADLRFDPAARIVMTEKDAVKCERYPLADAWYLEVEAVPEPGFDQWLDQRLRELRRG